MVATLFGKGIIYPDEQYGTDKKADILMYMVHINYRRISLLHNLRRKCRKIVKFVSIKHSERNIWNGPTVTTAISRKKKA